MFVSRLQIELLQQLDYGPDAVQQLQLSGAGMTKQRENSKTASEHKQV